MVGLMLTAVLEGLGIGIGYAIAEAVIGWLHRQDDLIAECLGFVLAAAMVLGTMLGLYMLVLWLFA